MAKANRKIRLRGDDEAIVGVGTLIVFIAMILVAAITAGVIIKTEYSLKDQAEKTATAAKAEATGGIKVCDMVGDRGNPAQTTLQTVKFTVTTWQGSDAINFGVLKIHWIGPTKELYLTIGGNGAPNVIPTADATHFGANEIPNGAAGNGWDLTQPVYYLDDDNVVYILIDLTNPGGGGTGINDMLGPNKHVTVEFIPAHGPVVTEEFVTPSDYGADRYIDLTNT